MGYSSAAASPAPLGSWPEASIMLVALPWLSASINRTRCLQLVARMKASSTAVVVLPTPPLRLTIANVLMVIPPFLSVP